ncbi:MAG: urease accessory protein UreD, partial [Cyanobacteria bacterium J06555_13]
PEPIILFSDAMLTQHMQVILHPQGRLVISEIIVPGRMARGEFYDFERYQSRLRVQRPTGKVCFADNLRLVGRANRFKHSPFLTGSPLMGNFIVVVPGIDLTLLVQALEAFSLLEAPLLEAPLLEAPLLEAPRLEEPRPEVSMLKNRLQACSSRLPGCQGLLVRALATQVSDLKAYQHHLLNCVRQLTGQPPLPPIPK